MIDQQDVGTYYCDVKIRNAESNELILHGKGMVIIDIVPESNPTTGPEPNPTTSSPPVAAIATPFAVGIVVIVIVVVVMVGTLMYIKRQQQQQRRQGYQQLDGCGKDFVQ